jgi:flagellar protein FlgJ
VADAGALYSDFTGLARLKVQAREGQAVARSETAKQFESLFLGQMLKAMRAASGGQGLLDSKQSLFYRDLQDQQLAAQMSKSGGVGLARVIERQLAGTVGASAAPGQGAEAADAGTKPPGRQVADYRAAPLWSPVPNTSPPAQPNAGAESGKAGEGGSLALGDGPVAFLRELWPHAERAARALGVAPEALLAQAALETGWGRHVMRGADGGSSHNLFGIKADPSWDGQLAHASTLEYKDGVAVKTRAAFRAYGSFAESFADYVGFLKANPRYQKALAAAQDPAAYVEELQRAGYATDPAYAAKLKRIMGSEDLARVREQLKGAGPRPI